MKQVDKIKNKIEKITIQEIKTRGYEHLSLRGLVKKLHLTTGAFYKRFPNKKSLFLDVTQILSQKIYQQILPKIGNYKRVPQKSLIQLGIIIIKLFSSDPNTMNFLFFNNELSAVYQNQTQENQFPLLKLAKELIAINSHNKNVNKNFIKLWSFIQGYCNLINHQVCSFNLELVKETLNQILGGHSHE